MTFYEKRERSHDTQRKERERGGRREREVKGGVSNNVVYHY